MQFSTNPNQSLKIESFEEFQATAAAVEQTQPNHELVSHMRKLGRQHFSLRTGIFIPTVLVDNEVETIDRQGEITRTPHDQKEFASVAYDALKRLSRSEDPHYAPVARFMLENAVYVDGPLEASTTAAPLTVIHDPAVRG